ncbi:ATP-binding protein [Embleya sp. AB8]|uniref:ATP-binding protein n=1 Tax=Embleya sp. AB8 TaxID=3156304 RepID=UPI003C79697D
MGTVNDLELPSQPDSVAKARAHVARGCREFIPFLDDAVAAVSELAANAIVHAGRYGGFSVAVEVRDGLLWIRVRDRFPCTLPGDPDGDPLAESGRGLVIAKSLADYFGYRVDPDGKTVCVAFKVDAHP